MKTLRSSAAPAALLSLLVVAGCPETVEPGDPSDTEGLTALRLDPAQLALDVGDTATLRAFGEEGEQESDVTDQVTWVSSDPNIASVASDGTVTGQNSGAATITGTLGILTSFASVDVDVGAATDAGPDPDPDAGPGGDVDTAIDVAPALASNSADASFGFSCSPQGCTFECELDGSGFAPCTTPRTLTGLSDGLHVFRVRALLDGAADASPAEHSWVIDTTLPETALTGGPPAVIASGDASFELSCDENECTFECQLDGAGWQTCASPHAVTVADGEHTLEARAIDAAGNVDDTPAAHVWTADTTPPDTSFSRTPAETSPATTAAFEFSCDEVACDYECELDDAGYAPCPSPHVVQGLVDGAHTFRVRAQDAAGNADQSPAEHTWTVDAGVAGLTFTSVPTSPTELTDATFEFTCDVATCVFECRLDGGAWAACASGEPVTGLGDGLHTFEVRVGTTAVPTEVNWIVDTQPAETTVDAAPPPLTNQTTASLTFSCDELGCTFECELDAAGFAACTSPVDYTALLDGEHVFRVRSTDAVGNVDATPASHTWTVNTDAPEVEIGGAPADRTNSTSASFDFTCNEEDCTYECQLDDGLSEPCSSPKVYFDLADGEHTFLVSATDGAGNKSTAPVEHTWTVDTSGPVVNVTAGPPNPSNDVDASFLFTCSEGACSFECQLDGTGFVSCVAPHEYLALQPGFHVFLIRATDAAGNTGDTTSYSWNIDLSGPATTLTSQPTDPATSTDASFSFDCDEATCTYECRVDGTAYETCTSPATYTLGYGAHTFDVRAEDGAGNTGPPASYAWTIECQVDGDCGTDRLCESGVCVAGNCRVEGDCNAGELCVNSFCSGCAADDECADGYVCLASGLCSVDVYGDGGDGAGTVSAATTADLSTVSISGRAFPDAPAYRVVGIGGNNVTLATSPGGALAAGDEVLLITMRGTQDLNTGERFHNNVGNAEVLRVSSVASNAVTFTSPVTETYGQTDNATLANQRFIVLYRVPNYENLTVEAGAVLTTRAFQPGIGQHQENDEVNNGQFGGVVFARVRGTLTVATGATITVQGLGYRGGNRNGDNGNDGQAGEGPAGFSRYGCKCNGDYNVGQTPSPRLENVGGGGSYVTGAGGGYGSAGTDATVWKDGILEVAEGGQPYGTPDLSLLFPGAGGGGVYNSGSVNCASLEGPAASGGGILALYARSAVVDGTLDASGDDGFHSDRSRNAYGTGGGAGGSLLFVADDVTLGGAVRALGGLGADPVDCGGDEVPPNRPGGDGGDGRIRFDFARVNGFDHGTSGADSAVSTGLFPAPGFSATP